MKRLMIALTVLFVCSISAFAQMGTGHGGGMMDGGWGWGMGYGWGFGIIIVILVIFGVAYMMKRK
jgi:Spy/CpxP family protein refolding chaperone